MLSWISREFHRALESYLSYPPGIYFVFFCARESFISVRSSGTTYFALQFFFKKFSSDFVFTINYGFFSRLLLAAAPLFFFFTETGKKMSIAEWLINFFLKRFVVGVEGEGGERYLQVFQARDVRITIRLLSSLLCGATVSYGGELFIGPSQTVCEHGGGNFGQGGRGLDSEAQAYIIFASFDFVFASGLGVRS